MTSANKTTQIHFILDRSGSMYEILNDTIGGFNSFIQSQKNDQNGECFMKVSFNSLILLHVFLTCICLIL